ncbi:MAG: flippase-like domain-containing protein, partial [Chloroflexi bacterium]|nr:flippase-like domain-containing protein [Chloroflexota bacterium]
ITYLFGFKVDVRTVAQVLAQANLWLALLALALYFVAVCVSATKWRLLLRLQRIEVPLTALWHYTFVGLFFGNFLLPLVAADVVRGYSLARHTEHTAEAAISVLVDKLVGLLAYSTAAAVMSLGVVLGWIEGRPALLAVIWVVWAAFGAFVLLFAALLSRRLRRLVERLFALPLLSKLAPIYHRLSEAIQPFRDRPLGLLKAFGISLGVLAIANMVNWLLAQALGSALSLKHIFLFNPMIAFAPIVIPSVGGLGVNQGAYDLFYSTLAGAIPSKVAISLSLLVQLLIYLSSLPGGVLWWRGRAQRRNGGAGGGKPA